jgi:hypothetical protein
MQDKKTCLIIQSGAMGDIFIVAPIARHYYQKGYLVYWPVRQPYFTFVSEYLDYVSAMLITDDKFPLINSDWLRSDTMHLKKIAERGHYDLVLDLADRGAKPNELPGEYFDETKYRIAEVPYSFKNHLMWTPNKEREQAVIDIIQHLYKIDITKDKYVVTHLESSHGDKAQMPESEKRTVVEITQYPGIEIADWYPVISHAQSVYCVESSVHQFIDGAVHRLFYDNPGIELFVLSRSSLSPGQSYTKSVNWDKKYMK